MAELRAARRYAQAAFQIAVDSGTIPTWRSDLADIAQVLSESDLAAALDDRRMPLAIRYEMIERVLDISPLALNLAKLLVQKGRSLDASAVADAFNELADEHDGIAHAEITTAVDLNPTQVANIEQQLSTTLNKHVQAVAAVDPAIIGGIIVRVGDRMVDASVRTRLKQLRKELQGAR
ncbi:ATP synthase F1 subunit delta [bacterium]|nr:ATP synthase F1 subunit delta [bacterium]